MKQGYAPIETLIERFFDGTTTNEEERELYAFFRSAGDDLPGHLAEYRNVFAWFEGGIAGEIAGEAPAIEAEAGRVEERKPRKVRMRRAAAAASLVLAVTLYSLHTMQKAGFDPLEGSYIIRNGVKITNLDEIRPELEASVQMALTQEAEAEQLFRRLREPGDDFPDAQRQMQQQYCRILSRYTDRNVREEVERILGLSCGDE